MLVKVTFVEAEMLQKEGYDVSIIKTLKGLCLAEISEKDKEEVEVCLEYSRNNTKGAGTIHYKDFLEYPFKQRRVRQVDLSEILKLINTAKEKELKFACDNIGEKYIIYYHREIDKEISNLLDC